MSKHWKYGGSTAEKTTRCHQWASLSAKLPPAPVSDVAEDGTAMHTALETCLNDPDFDPDDYIGHQFGGRNWTRAFSDKVWTALEVVQALESDNKLRFTPEISHEHNELVGGTADLVGWNKKTNVFMVGDLKTGDGVQVYAENNSQLLFYTWLMIEKFRNEFSFNDDTVFKLFIIQPSERRDEPLDLWETSLAKVLDFSRNFLSAVKLAESGKGITRAGKWCKFCRAATICPEKTGLAAAALRLDPEQVENLNQAMAVVEEVEDWVRQVRALAHEQMQQGVAVDGWKLVQKRATRSWVSDVMAAEQLTELGDEAFVKKIITPAQAEKICKKKSIDFSKMSSNIESVSSGTTIAHTDDKRPAVLPLGAIAAMARNVKT